MHTVFGADAAGAVFHDTMVTPAAAEAREKWNGGRSPRAYPLPSFCGPGVLPREIFENVGANLCNLVHFGDIRSSKVGRKIDAFPPHF